MANRETRGRPRSERTDEGLQKVLEAVDSLEAIATACGITEAAVSDWDKVPPVHVPAVSDLTGIPDFEIRPDIFRRPAKAASSPEASVNA